MVNLKLDFKLLLTILALLCLVTSERIIPDPNYPVLLKYASSNAFGTEIELRFKLPIKTVAGETSATSFGISYGQFIGIKFSADSTLNFSSLIPSCKLESATKKFTMEYKIPETSSIVNTIAVDNSILFCRLVDRVENRLPAMETLTLTLTFPTKFPTFFIQNIGLFTSTTNTPNRVMIDSIPVLGSIGIYKDFTSQSLNHIVTIKNGNASQLSTITSPSNPPSASVIYPNYTVDIRVELTFNQYWIVDPEDYTFYFKWDLTSYGLPNTVRSEASSATATNEANLLNPSLSFIAMTDGVIVSGFSDGELYPNRKFKIVFSGLKTSDRNLGSSKNLALYIFYKNTYSVVSYSTVAMDVVNKIPLVNSTTVVKHPELFPIYDGMGWPFQFEFSSPVDIVGGVYVVIRQRDFAIKTSSVVLVASTCDTSLNSGVEQTFGQRWSCYPLRNDFNYDTTTGTTFVEGQGIFFKINNTLVANQLFTLRVWGFVDVCVGTTQANNYAATLSFTIRLYKNASVNDGVKNEKRFFDSATGNYVVAESTLVQMVENCYHLQTRTDLTAAGINADMSKIPQMITDHYRPIGIEINNISLAKEPSPASSINSLSLAATPYLSYQNGVSSDPPAAYAEQYLFSTGSTLSNSAFFMFGITRGATTAVDTSATTSYLLVDYIPSECRSSTVSQYLSSITEARIQWLFSRQWLAPKTTITAGCQISWEWYSGVKTVNTALIFDTGITHNGASNTDSHKTTITSLALSVGPEGGFTTTRSKNMDTSGTTSSISSTSTGTLVTYKITSTSFSLASPTLSTIGLSLIGTACNQTRALYNQTDGPTYTDANVIGVYSNCLQFNTAATITWMYSYFEVQGLLLNNTRPLRIWRFIKLYPEIGVFNSPTSMESVTDAASIYTDISQRWITAHYQATTGSYTPFAVCLIEIDPVFINVFKDTTSNTLVIWLFATSLLETDVLTASNEYPISPSTNNKAYGFNSGQTMGMAFRRIGDTASSTNLFPEPDNHALLSELEMYFYNTVLHYGYRETAASVQSDNAPTGFKMSRTLYHFYMGSAIYIPASSTFGTDSNIYIPFLCPSYSGYNSSAASTYPTNGIYWVHPIVSAAWVTMTSYSSISGVQRYIRPTPKASDLDKNNTIEVYHANQKFIRRIESATISSPIMFPLLRSKRSAGDTIAVTNNRTASTITTRVASLASLKLQFNSYRLITENLDKKLIITNTASNSHISSISIFVNSSIDTLSTTIETNVAVTNGNNSTSMKVGTLGSKIHILGKPFDRFLAYSYTPYSLNDLRSNIPYGGASSAITDNLFAINTASTITITGIPRIALDKLNSTQYVHLVDYIAVFMNRNTYYTTDNKIFTNLYYSDETDAAVFKNFLLFHPDVDNTNWSAVLGVDSTGASVKSDKAGNIKVTGTIPSRIPSGSQIVLDLDSGVIIPTTRCGLKEGVKTFATECVSTGTSVTCQLTESATTFQICCYNIFNNSVAMKVTSGDVKLPYNSAFITSAVASTYANTWYRFPLAANSFLAYFDFSTRASTDLSNLTTAFFASVKSLNYSISSTNGGIGKATLYINLPREAVRGMVLKIVTNISSMKIPNIQPRIVPTFGSSTLYGANPDEGDALLEDVYSGFDSTGIEIRLKNIIYKCGISLSNNLYVHIWPVYTPSYSKLSVSIQMKSADGTDIALSTAHDVTSKPEFTDALISYNADMCKLSSVNPRIVGEYAQYTFEVSLSQVASNIDNLTLNEVIIYFPHQHFEEMSDVVCYAGNASTPLQCSFIEKSMLSIRTANLSRETANTFSIVGLKNPYLATNNGEYFACSINNTNFYTNTRLVRFAGTFTFNAGIFDNLTDTVFGNITFLNNLCYQTFTIVNSAAASTNTSQGTAVASVESMDPREDPPKIDPSRASLHQFAFTIDIAQDFITSFPTGYTFNNSPVLYITFPPEYKFHWYSFTPTATIESFFSIQTDLKSIEKKQLIEVDKITVVGNQLRITFTDASTKAALSAIAFDKYFQYFLIKIFNLPSPVESTSFVDGRKTTERFNFTFFNSASTARTVFRNWTNMHNLGLESFATNNKINDLIPNHKGFAFDFDDSRWVIDIVDKSNNVNVVKLATGRFVTYYFKRRSNNQLTEPSHVDISLTHNTIKLIQPSYNYASAINSSVPFKVGVACNTDPGYIIANMDLAAPKDVTRNIYDLFLPLSPVVYTIDNSTKGVISFVQDNIVRVSGSIFVDFDVDFPSFDPISINFTASATSSIDNTVLAVAQDSVRTVMRVTPEAREIQSFMMGEPTSKCYRFKSDRIRFSINGVVAIIPNDALKASNFQYFNSEMDTTLAASSIKFKFASEYTQIYMYAALTCTNEDFPSDQALLNSTILYNSTDKTKYYTDILNVSGATDIVFTNLLRGSSYKLKVIITSTNGIVSDRTQSKIELMNYTLTNGTIVSFNVPRSIQTRCLSYRFNTRPGIQVTSRLLWYWQSRFNLNGYYESGCITPVDQYGSQVPGLPSIRNETNCGRQNCRFIDQQDYIVNQTSLGVSQTYTICAYPLATCDVNPVSYSETISSIQTTLSTNTTFKTVLNIEVTPEFTIFEASDSSPSAPTISQITRTGNRISFKAVSNSAVQCFVRPASASTAPILSQFQTCSDDCTVVNISSTEGTYTITVSNNNELNIYAVCYNELFCSSSSTAVLNFGRAASNGNNNNNSTNNSTNGTDQNGTNNSVSNLKGLSFVIMLLILSLLN